MKRLCIAVACCAAIGGHCAIVEVERWVPAKAVDTWGHEFTRDVKLTVFYEDSVDGPRPLAIINHGRGNAEERKRLGRARYAAAARWFVKQGFIVAIPTRIGYGVTGGPDIEDTGGCTSSDYAPGYAAAATQTVTVLGYLGTWKEVDRNRVLVLGNSAGGTTAITVASLNLPGVRAAINFAGGGGGRPKTHPGDPCSPNELKALFAEYGKTSRIPTLWMYSENDEYAGSKLPKEWFAAFRDAGGRGEFVSLPAYPGGGHGFFTNSPESWQPKVESFLGTLKGLQGRVAQPD